MRQRHFFMMRTKRRSGFFGDRRQNGAFMPFWEAALCGIIQGLTEFLPVSSSGHLALAHAFFGLENAESYLTFDILLHLATLLVVVIVYFEDVFSLIPAFFTVAGKIFRGKFCFSELEGAERTVSALIVGTIPLVGAVFLKERVELLLGRTEIVAVILFANGCMLLLADRLQRRERDGLTLGGAFGIGVFQLAAALLPGLSRSGATIVGGMLFGFSRREAVKFSFLLSIPAVLGANLTNAADALSNPISADALSAYLVGMAAAAVAGFCAVKLLTYISEKNKFGFFAYYCMTIGVLSLALIALH